MAGLDVAKLGDGMADDEAERSGTDADGCVTILPVDEDINGIELQLLDRLGLASGCWAASLVRLEPASGLLPV